MSIRTGRANTALVDHLIVDYYGTPTPLNQIASIATPEPRLITVQPWDRSAVQAINKAILKSELGLNPADDGTTIRVPIPPLTEERRRELIKVVKHEGENTKVAVRNLRRDANASLKDMLKAKTVSEDQERRAQDEIQKLTDRYIAEIDKVLAAKESDLMAV